MAHKWEVRSSGQQAGRCLAAQAALRDEKAWAQRQRGAWTRAAQAWAASGSSLTSRVQGPRLTFPFRLLLRLHRRFAQPVVVLLLRAALLLLHRRRALALVRLLPAAGRVCSRSCRLLFDLDGARELGDVCEDQAAVRRGAAPRGRRLLRLLPPLDQPGRKALRPLWLAFLLDSVLLCQLPRPEREEEPGSGCVRAGCPLHSVPSWQPASPALPGKPATGPPDTSARSTAQHSTVWTTPCHENLSSLFFPNNTSVPRPLNKHTHTQTHFLKTHLLSDW
jgi:hypothetical protein